MSQWASERSLQLSKFKRSLIMDCLSSDKKLNQWLCNLPSGYMFAYCRTKPFDGKSQLKLSIIKKEDL